MNLNLPLVNADKRKKLKKQYEDNVEKAFLKIFERAPLEGDVFKIGEVYFYHQQDDWIEVSEFMAKAQVGHKVSALLIGTLGTPRTEEEKDQMNTLIKESVNEYIRTVTFNEEEIAPGTDGSLETEAGEKQEEESVQGAREAPEGES